MPRLLVQRMERSVAAGEDFTGMAITSTKG
jgi:hypothetical protein